MNNTYSFRALVAAALCAVNISWTYAVEAIPNKYPPYPEIWDWRVPDPAAYVPGWLRAYLLDDGDVLILYSQSEPTATKKRRPGGSSAARSADRKLADLLGKATGKGALAGDIKSRQVTFFSGRTLIAESSNVRIMRDEHRTKTLQLSDGSTARIVKDDWGRKAFTQLKNGTWVSSKATKLHDCYEGPAWSNINIFQQPDGDENFSHGRTLLHKVVFFLLDKSEKWEGASSRACEEHDKKLIVRVKALRGTGVLPLPDGSFLIVDDDAGRIIRFKEDLTTHSPLLNKQMFIFDMTHLSELFMPAITGRSYVIDGEVRMQRILDDLYEYLLQLRAKG